MLSGLPPPRGRDFQDRSGWTAWLLLAIPILFFAGIAIRLWLLPSRGLVGDVDQFVLWVHGIAVNGWDRAYDQNLSFPAVMAWVWGAAGGDRARVPDRDRLGGPGHPVADEDPGLARRPGHRGGGHLVVPRAAAGTRSSRPAPSCCGRRPGTCPRGGASTSRSTSWARSSRCSRPAPACRWSPRRCSR